MASLVAQMVKLLPAMQETQVRSLGQEDLLEKEMATHSSALAWKIPWTEEPGGLPSMGSHRVRHDWSDLAAAVAAEYIIRNARLDEAQDGIKIAGRNINNLRYADDTNLMRESEEKLKSLFMKMKEESKNIGLKLNI